MQTRPIIACAALATALSSAAMALEPVAEFGPNPGDLAMFEHLPDGPVAGLPVVLALHGCAQSADRFDDETGLTALAEAVPFVLVLAEQSRRNNPFACFNWFSKRDNRPGAGESASLRRMVEHAVETHDLDRSRVFVMGLSAGGSMTAVMLANYPELFAGGAILAGTPFDCNRPHGFSSGLWFWTSMSLGDGAAAALSCGLRPYDTKDRTRQDWADAVRAVAGTTPARWPRVSIWFGDRDRVVDPANLGELVEQWTELHGTGRRADQQESIAGATRWVYADPSGATAVEAWLVQGFPHAVPIDADGAPAPCGREADFIADADLCAVRRIAAFWGLLP